MSASVILCIPSFRPTAAAWVSAKNLTISLLPVTVAKARATLLILSNKPTDAKAAFFKPSTTILKSAFLIKLSRTALALSIAIIKKSLLTILSPTFSDRSP